MASCQGTRRSVVEVGRRARSRRSPAPTTRHRVALDRCHLDVDGQQVVAPLGAVGGDLVEEVPRGQPLALQATLDVGHRQQHRVDLAADPTSALSSSSVMDAGRPIARSPDGRRGPHGAPRGRARPAGGRAGGRWAAGSRTATCACGSAAATTSSALVRQGHRGARHRPRGGGRGGERARTRSASRPRSCCFLPEDGCVVTRFVAGRQATAAEVRSPAAAGAPGRRRCAPSTRGPPLPVAFDVPALAAAYAAETVARGGVVPAAYADAAGAGRPHRRRDRGPAHPEHAPVPCHDDLLDRERPPRPPAATSSSSTGSTPGWATASSTSATSR